MRVWQLFLFLAVGHTLWAYFPLLAELIIKLRLANVHGMPQSSRAEALAPDGRNQCVFFVADPGTKIIKCEMVQVGSRRHSMNASALPHCDPDPMKKVLVYTVTIVFSGETVTCWVLDLENWEVDLGRVDHRSRACEAWIFYMAHGPPLEDYVKSLIERRVAWRRFGALWVIAWLLS